MMAPSHEVKRYGVAFAVTTLGGFGTPQVSAPVAGA